MGKITGSIFGGGLGGTVGSILGGGIMGPVGSALGGLTGAKAGASGNVLGGASKLLGGAKNMLGVDSFKAGESQFTPQLQRALGVLENRVSGNAPSVAEMQMKEGLDSSLSDTVSAIRSAPSVSPALQARMIASAGQDQAGELARAQSILRAGEQAGAEQSLIQGLGQARSTDAGLESVRAGSFADKARRRGDLAGNVIGGIGQVFGMGG
jgi:hypothetical protein